ncbi:MAG: hypothetical protein KAR20_02195, partial [Candidatus Heimdallarchaeota archaeon]|nr:hypothetical protein [Candidatus Heimdallarchaeota archaeon]
TWDASVEIIAAIKKGEIDLALAQKPYEIGYLAVEWGYKYLTAGTKIPYKVIPGFESFTSENVNDPDMDQYIYK